MASEKGNADGKVPDKSPVALLLIDVINDLEFPGGENLLPPALEAIEKIAKLKKRAQAAGIPVIYVNDNFGRWQSDFKKTVAHALQAEMRGRPLVEQILPDGNDYFVLKPKHSGFYSTTLDTLLDYLGAQVLILVGFASDICVLFTANDAYMRDFKVYVPRDCVAANKPEYNQQALELMARVLKADTRPSTELELRDLKEQPA